MATNGEGFRMPFGVRKPAKHEPAGLRQGLWGFGLFTERDHGGVGSSIKPRRMRRTRLCARRSLDRELAACEIEVSCHGAGEGRADGDRWNKGRFGAR
jgi:hypothetical protein